MKETASIPRIEEALRACLRGVQFIQVLDVDPQQGWAPCSSDTRVDFAVRVRLPYGEHLIVVEVKQQGEPRHARAAVNQLSAYTANNPTAYGVFAAPYISPVTAAICRQGGVGYIDLAGNCHLEFGYVYIHKEGNPNPFLRQRPLNSLYSPKATRVLRVLLAKSSMRVWSVSDLASESQVSLGHVSNVKRLLVDQEWLQTLGSAFTLAKPAELLADWAQHYRIVRTRIHDFYAMGEVPEIEARVARSCDADGLTYALTEFSGAERYAPFVRYQRVVFYLQAPIDPFADTLGFKRVPSGANVRIIEPHDDGVFFGARQVDGHWVASPIQVYLDLCRAGGRGEDAAQAVHEEVIRKLWM